MHLRNNKIERINEKHGVNPRGIPLSYLNLRENQIATFEALDGIQEFANISSMNFLATPLTDEKGGDLKKELLILYCD